MAMAPHSSTLAWKIPWMEEPGRLQSTGSLRVTSLSLFTFMHWRRKWQPTPMFLPGESQGRGSLVGCCLMGLHRVGHDWSDLAAAKIQKSWKQSVTGSCWICKTLELGGSSLCGYIIIHFCLSLCFSSLPASLSVITAIFLVVTLHLIQNGFSP